MSPATLENSPVLCVTKVNPLLNAMAAIIRSFGPIGVPAVASFPRSRPYSTAAESSKGNDSYGAKNISNFVRAAKKNIVGARRAVKQFRFDYRTELDIRRFGRHQLLLNGCRSSVQKSNARVRVEQKRGRHECSLKR